MAKEVLRKQLWQIADFSGVEVITYCVMDNHFHTIVRVPDREKVMISDKELMRRCRVRYFTDGAALGSEEFVQGIFEEFRSQFGAKRRRGPRQMKGSDWEGLTVLRDLRREVFG